MSRIDTERPATRINRNMGRIWAVLYLSPDPLSAEDLRLSLRLSSGAVSMTLNELLRWGVVRKVCVQGERKDFYTAEVQLWRMISRVFNERERVEVLDAIDIMEDAIRFLKDKAREPQERARAQFQEARIRELLDLARLGKQLNDALIKDAKVDGSPLMSVLLGEPKSASRVQVEISLDSAPHGIPRSKLDAALRRDPK